MKKLLLTIVIGGAVCVSLHADTIRQWDFNSLTIDFIPQTGTDRPNNGSGAPAQAIGGVGNRFGANATASQPADPNTADNSHWRLGQSENLQTGLTDPESGFPVATNANKTAGTLFPVNTSGYNNIRVTWNQENSATASRYWRIQYTTNGTDWLDTTNVVTALSIDSNGAETGTPVWQNNLAADFSALEGVNNNPNFAFRLVSEFESTATGSGTNAYVANRVTGGYTRGGTLWLELVTVTGDSIDPGNQWPVVSAIADQNILTNESTGALAFTILDAETVAEDLVVSAQSSDTSLINTLALVGSSGSRTITATPEPGKQGTAIVTIRVQDAGGKVTESAFGVVVTIPTIFPMADQITSWDAPVTVPVLTTNLPGDPATEWTITAASSNPSVVANSGLVFGTSAASNYLAITPVANATGETIITITNTGARAWKAVQSFKVTLLPARIVFFDLTGLPSTGGTNQAWPTIVSNGLSVSTLTRGPGLRMAGLANGFSSDGWNTNTASRANAIADEEYCQFTVTVGAGYQMSLASIETSLRRSAIDGPMNYEWQYSLDGFATPGITITNFSYIGRSSGTAPVTVTPYQWMTKDTAGQNAGNPTWPFFLYTIPGLQNIPAGTTVTIRLYAWGNGNGAYSNTVALGRVNGPMIRGTVEALPQAPTLVVNRSGSDVVISWPTSASGYTLQSTASLSPAGWQTAPETPVVVGDNNVVTLTNPAGARFFRLAQ